MDSGSILTMNLLGIRRVSYIAMALGKGGGGALTAWDYNEDVAGNRSRIMWGKEHMGKYEFFPSVIGGGDGGFGQRDNNLGQGEDAEGHAVWRVDCAVAKNF